ncbi:hypothetical protein ACK3SF_00680 [Candidatus Nanosalina sp. VS9-1]|uniref:hypothetical protein n=1 Tax=Candidatus Nanosalina sp. VS9-1 TaxID=3388566 RepID=UPI0039E13D76
MEDENVYRPSDFALETVAEENDFDPEAYKVDSATPYAEVSDTGISMDGYEELIDLAVQKLEGADYIDAVHLSATGLRDSIETSGLVPKSLGAEGSGTWPPSHRDKVYFTGEDTDNHTPLVFENSWASAPVRSFGGRPMKVHALLDADNVLSDDNNKDSVERIVRSLMNGAFAHQGPVTPGKEQGSTESHIYELEAMDEPALLPLEKRWGGKRYEYGETGFWPSGWEEFSEEEQRELEELNEALGEAWEENHQRTLGDSWR